MKLCLDRRKISEDVSMIELEIVQDGSPWTVMNELGALVKKRRVVFICLDHEQRLRRASGRCGTQPRRNAEVLRYTANQKTGLATGGFQYPGQHGRGGGLAVRAGHRQHPALMQYVLGQPLRPGDVGQAAIEDGLHQRIAARHDIANDPEIRGDGQLRGVPARNQFDALLLELGAHGRIDVGIATGDTMASLTRQHRNAAHEGAADSQDVYMHGGIVVAARRVYSCAWVRVWSAVCVAVYHASINQAAPGPKSKAMSKDYPPPRTSLRQHVAAAAARIMAEEGVDDYAQAKRKAAKRLGATDSQSLPGNEEIEAALRSYQALYQEDEQRERIQEMRAVALDAMQALAEFRPYLAGPVLRGTAARYGDIDLHLFTDDEKGVEIYLINEGIEYELEPQRQGGGKQRAAVLRCEWQDEVLRLSVFSANQERIRSPYGERANAAALQLLLEDLESGAKDTARESAAKLGYLAEDEY